MRETRLLMGMPITVEVVNAGQPILDRVFAYFADVDRRFSTYRDDSEIAALNRGEILPAACSAEMREVLALAERTRAETGGYFEIRANDGRLDPSGIVKGWAIRNAATLIAESGARDFFVDAGGDLQCRGVNADGQSWRVGIRNPFCADEIVKVISPGTHGVATSGTYARGQHIYDPFARGRPIVDVVSLTVVAADVMEADRFATAAFAMGRDGIAFIEQRPGLEGYLVRRDSRAIMTSGFGAFVATC